MAQPVRGAGQTLCRGSLGAPPRPERPGSRPPHPRGISAALGNMKGKAKGSLDSPSRPNPRPALPSSEGCKENSQSRPAGAGTGVHSAPNGRGSSLGLEGVAPATGVGGVHAAPCSLPSPRLSLHGIDPALRCPDCGIYPVPTRLPESRCPQLSSKTDLQWPNQPATQHPAEPPRRPPLPQDFTVWGQGTVGRPARLLPPSPQARAPEGSQPPTRGAPSHLLGRFRGPGRPALPQASPGRGPPPL